MINLFRNSQLVHDFYKLSIHQNVNPEIRILTL